MKYKGYLLRKVDKQDYHYHVEIYKNDRVIAIVPDFTTAKDLIDKMVC